jgi:dynein heavy chain
MCVLLGVCMQVRRYLHVVLCFSPVGDKFRIRARQFPALVNCTQLDWFHGWPHEALLSVAQRFLADVPDIADDVRGSMAEHMAQAHQVGVVSALQPCCILLRHAPHPSL